MIITIDGPSGTGKTTVARQVANALHFSYFDTGAMYRAFAWVCLQKNVDLHDSEIIKKLLSEFDFNIADENNQKHYFVNGNDVTEAIRSRPVTACVSAVSALREVRDALLPIQHRFGSSRNAVFEGRDLGTIVFPHAEIKIFLTADPAIRAERRMEELLVKSPKETALLSKEQLLSEINRRDAADSTREIAPLRCPDNAYTIDTTHLSIDQVVEEIIKYTQKKL